MITPSIAERAARQALAQNRVFDETLVRGLLTDIDRLREQLEQLEQQKKPPASSGRQSGG